MVENMPFITPRPVPWVDRREHFGEVRTAQMDLDWDARATFWIEHRKKTHWIVERKGLYTQSGIHHLGRLTLQIVLVLIGKEFEKNKDSFWWYHWGFNIIQHQSHHFSLFFHTFPLKNTCFQTLRIWKVIFHRSLRQQVVSYLQHICAPKNIGEICLA